MVVKPMFMWASTRRNIYPLTHTHTHTFNGPLSGTTQVSQYQKVKPIWILLKQETVSGSGICWAICKSAPSSRQIPHQHLTAQFFTGRMPFLPPTHTHNNHQPYFNNFLHLLLSIASSLFSVYCIVYVIGSSFLQPLSGSSLVFFFI